MNSEKGQRSACKKKKKKKSVNFDFKDAQKFFRQHMVLKLYQY